MGHNWIQLVHSPTWQMDRMSAALILSGRDT
jgi:hypothetical protein